MDDGRPINHEGAMTEDTAILEENDIPRQIRRFNRITEPPNNLHVPFLISVEHKIYWIVRNLNVRDKAGQFKDL
jgi:hypothetical protein